MSPDGQAASPLSRAGGSKLPFGLKIPFSAGGFRLAIRLLLGGVFIYSGASKLAEPQAFADSIATFQLFPAATINLIALVLPPFEILLGLALVSGFKKRAAALGLVLLCAIFVVSLGQAILRGLEIDCGCFGSAQPSRLGGLVSFVRASVLLCASGWLYRTMWTCARGIRIARVDR